MRYTLAAGHVGATRDRDAPWQNGGIMSGYAPVRGKCGYWREAPSEDDRWDTSIKAKDRRVECSCFVEGQRWSFTASTVPADCPEYLRCRYYVKH